MTITTTRAIPAEVMAYLALHHIITVSTPSFTGMPHADTVVYVNDDSCIYFHADEGSTLARNIRDSKYVSFTIDDYQPDWRKLRELQGVGRGELVAPGDAAPVDRLVAAKFGDAFATPPGRLHRLLPIEMHFVDYDDVSGQRSPETSRVSSIERRGALATSLDRVGFSAGEVIFRAGEQTGRYYIVVDGLVEVRREGFGADQTVTRVGPGQMFGDEPDGRRGRGLLTAHALEPTTLLTVDPDAVRDMVLPRDS